jgi:hypothetical protein
VGGFDFVSETQPTSSARYDSGFTSPDDDTAATMPYYRVYAITADGHVAAPPTVIECSDDQEALGKAAQHANGKSLELWEGARFIVRFPSNEGWVAWISKAVTVLF